MPSIDSDSLFCLKPQQITAALSLHVTDFDECRAADASRRHTCDVETTRCVNTLGSYECHCKPGFTRDFFDDTLCVGACLFSSVQHEYQLRRWDDLQPNGELQHARRFVLKHTTFFVRRCIFFNLITFCCCYVLRRRRNVIVKHCFALIGSTHDVQTLTSATR